MSFLEFCIYFLLASCVVPILLGVGMGIIYLVVVWGLSLFEYCIRLTYRGGGDGV